MSGNECNDRKQTRFKRLLAWTRSTTPVIALAAMALALLPISESTCQEVCEASLFRKFTVTGFTCLVLGSTLLTYWAAKDGRQDVPASIRYIWAKALKLHPQTAELLAKGMMIMLQTIKARAITLASEKARAEGHTEGHTEGHAQAKAKYQSWLNRQKEAGTLSYDESDPPPD